MVRNRMQFVASLVALGMLSTPVVSVAQNRAAVIKDCAPQQRAASDYRRVSARNQRASVAYEEREQERTKTKTALMIGGSAATGAGVGAVVNGTRGALIGAAIGGGAAAIYESAKRR